MAAYDDQHFSPTLANRWWAKDGRHYVCYATNDAGSVSVNPRLGKTKWGKDRRLWPTDVEQALNHDLETPVARTYRGLVEEARAPIGRERVKWAQFLMSQVVRTPTFIRYEKFAAKLHGITAKPGHDRTGCEHCGDLTYVTARDWAILAAHEGDFFIRTDNPVVLTGPLERNETVIYYPLTPRWCFVALPLRPDTIIAPKSEDPMCGWPIEKGAAHLINFYCAKHADRSLIVHPDHDNLVSQTMLKDTSVFGGYPQPPFLLHAPHQASAVDVLESVRLLQSACDGVEYPTWDAADLEGAAQHLLGAIRRPACDRSDPETA